MPFDGPTGEKLRKVVLVTVSVLGLFLVFEATTTAMQLRYIGAGITPANTITVSGHGELLAVPDIATFSASVVSVKGTVADAQAEATAKANAITAYLKSAGVDEKDIKTTGYAIAPQYEYQTAVCPAGVVNQMSYCAPSRQVLKGYEVRQTTEVKVRDTKKAGDLLAGVGSKGATEVSGLSFTFDDPDQPQQEARDKAIADAKENAHKLASQLGVTLVRISSFNESGSPQVYPTAYGMGGGMMAKDAAAPEISVGQNEIESNVSITYEIR